MADDTDRATYRRHNTFVAAAAGYTQAEIALALAEGAITPAEAAERAQIAAQAVRDNFLFHAEGRECSRRDLFGRD